jgi:UDP-N-acetylmuramoylalanine--D-glutamate ligase
MTNGYRGARVVVIGLGRAGFGMSKTLNAAGAKVLAVDEKSADNPDLLAASDALCAAGVDVITSWSGDLQFSTVDLIAPSPGVSANHPTLRAAAAAGVPIHSEMEIAYRISRAPIIAVTGTNGKSTVTALTWHMLKTQKQSAILCGNIAGSGYDETVVTTAALNAGPADILVAEVSSFQLEWIAEFRPRAAAIIQIAPDHLDRYSSFEQYAATKRKVFSNMGAGDTAVAHHDRPETFPPSESGVKVLSIGSTGCDALLERGRLSFVNSPVVIESRSLWFPGQHNLENCAFASLLSLPFGATLEGCAQAITSFKGLRNRMEFVGEQAGVRYINNSMCTNPAAVESSLSALEGSTLLLAGGVCKVSDLSPLVRIAPKLKKAFLFGRDAPKLAGAITSGGCDAERFDTLDDALNAARTEAVAGDTVILAPGCASFDQFDSFIERGDRFRSLVLEHAHA